VLYLKVIFPETGVGL